MDKIKQFIDLFIDVWKDGISGINISEIVIAILIFFVFLLLRGFFAKFIIKRLEKYVSKTTNRFDNSLVQSLKGPTKFFPIVIGFFIATSYVSLGDSTENFVDNANRTLITILIFWSIHQIIGPLSVLIKSIEDLLSKDLLNWIIKAIKVLILILGAAAVLELWGIKIGPIIAGLGLFGVAVALGAQDLFKNLISGILVLVEKRFKVGDWIIVENIIEGIVERIGFRSTVVRKFDKSIAIIPNFQFAENAVINISQTTNWLISWIITLQYNTTVEQLKKIRDEIEKYVTSHKDFKSTLGHAVRIDKFSDSSIDMYVRCFTVTDDWAEWLAVKERLAIEIKQIVEKNSASFAFPSQSIYVEKK
ncbi:MAG: mechanosensitive ion channel protein MscS [Pelagibacteraceae bacterium TMED237]|nr:MAG: mechanosensitive ion channel protein MscS [Pelagibacteraceae bacterium TMED237]|tara:strand:- start:5318 stop:6403 length:1086 start_codon:yes stop_codon:yes gene_type:complete